MVVDEMVEYGCSGLDQVVDEDEGAFGPEDGEDVTSESRQAFPVLDSSGLAMPLKAAVLILQIEDARATISTLEAAPNVSLALLSQISIAGRLENQYEGQSPERV
ncbi:hypothetical protein M405DRAFT_839597 [Rhizopogon salebrosus TDB-379]|nr:hypothetical protein M405DRAFT_839597 [Rhizopogon salebrosus TDB-379]